MFHPVSGQARDLPETAPGPHARHEAQSRLCRVTRLHRVWERVLVIGGLHFPMVHDLHLYLQHGRSLSNTQCNQPIDPQTTCETYGEDRRRFISTPMKYIGYRLLRCSLKPNLGLPKCFLPSLSYVEASKPPAAASPIPPSFQGGLVLSRMCTSRSHQRFLNVTRICYLYFFLTFPCSRGCPGTGHIYHMPSHILSGMFPILNSLSISTSVYI